MWPVTDIPPFIPHNRSENVKVASGPPGLYIQAVPPNPRNMKDTFNIYLKLLLRVSPALSTSDYRSFSETWCPGTSENWTSFPQHSLRETGTVEMTSSQPPAMCIFILSTPYHASLKSRREREASLRMCRWPFDALTTEILRMSAKKPSVQRQVSEDQFWKTAKRGRWKDPWCFGWGIKWGTAPQCFFDIRGLSEARGILVLSGGLFYPLQNRIWKSLNAGTLLLITWLGLLFWRV